MTTTKAAYQISYYGKTEAARTAAAALRKAKQMTNTYGQGNRNPVIDAETEADAAELVKMMGVAQLSYCVRVNGEPVI